MKRDSLYKQKVLCGKAIKAMLISEGARDDQVFQNIYKTGTRSIKCYTGSVDVIRVTAKARNLANIFGFDAKFNLTKATKYSSSGYIVKI